VLVESDGESQKTTDAVRSRLEAAQLSVVRNEATDARGAATSTTSPGSVTTIAATSDSPSAQSRAREVAAALGLPASSVVVKVVKKVAGAGYDVLVQLGSDLEKLLRLAGLDTTTPAPTGT